MKTQDIKNIASAYMQVQEKAKMDPVNPDELKGTHAQRKDKDIDNDGKVDGTDKYLHARRKAVKTAMKKEEAELEEAAPKIKPDFVKTQREKDRAHDAAMGRTPTGRKKTMTSTQRSMASMRKEDTDMNNSRWPVLQRIMERQNHGNMDNGSPRGEGLSPSAKTELSRSMGDSGIDGAKAAADTAKAATANVKVAPKRTADQTIGDKNPIDSTKA
jgi:hypothetical protein